MGFLKPDDHQSPSTLSISPHPQVGWCERGSSKDKKALISLQGLAPPHPAVGQRAPVATLFVAFSSLKWMTKMTGKPEALLFLIPNKPWSALWYMAQWSNRVFQRVLCVICHFVTLQFSKWWFSTKMKIILFSLLKSNNSIIDAFLNYFICKAEKAFSQVSNYQP